MSGLSVILVTPSRRQVTLLSIYTITMYENLPNAINRGFLALKIEKFQLKNFDIFLIFAQNIDCGYTLEPPR